MVKFRDKKSPKKNDAWTDWLTDDRPSEEVSQLQQRPQPVTPKDRLRYAGSYKHQMDGFLPGNQLKSGLKPKPTTVRPKLNLSIYPKPTPKPIPSKKPTRAPITVQISLQKPSLPKLPPQVKEQLINLRSKLSRTQLLFIGLAVIGFMALIIAGPLFLGRSKNGNQAGVAGVSKNGHSTLSGVVTPAFKPMFPIGKPDLATLKDPSKTNYDEQRQVFSFSDTINATAITVSQQQVPENILNDADGLQKVAKTIRAGQTFDTHWGKVYQTTNPKTQSQTVVFMANGLLVFAQSVRSHDNNAWIAYVNDLTFQ